MNKLSYIHGSQGGNPDAPEYLAHFGLSRSPFTGRPHNCHARPTIDPDEVVRQLNKAITSPGMTFVSGADDAVRTRILGQTVERIESQVPLARFARTPEKASRFLAGILEAFGFDSFSSTLPQYRNVLTAFLTHQSQNNDVALVVLEDAGSMTEELIEEVVRLMRDQSPDVRVHILFFSQPGLAQHVEAAFANLKCRYLELDKSESINVADYVFGRLNAAGLSGRSLFTQHAIKYLEEIAGDDIESIDRACHLGLESASRSGLKKVNKAVLQAVKKDIVKRSDVLENRPEKAIIRDIDAPMPIPRRHSSLVMAREGKHISRFDLRRERLTLGRHRSNDIYIPRPGISLFHAILVVEGRDVYLFDLRSTNGTCVNGQEVSRRRLTDGDVIFFGSLTLTFCQGNIGISDVSDNDVLPGFAETVVLEGSDSSDPTAYMQSTL